MDRKTRRKLRLAKLCRKYGYHETESLLRRQLEKRRLATSLTEAPILRNLSRREEEPPR